ncbi:MAG: helix-turn-helix domain-containing protein [Bacteroidales bacterium]|nr:helix-turn-helix domain-containing protein [Bacteroidales bacterium]
MGNFTVRQSNSSWEGFEYIIQQDLPDLAKLIYLEIFRICKEKEKGYCYATNGYFEKKFNRKTGAISSSISELKKMCLIKIEFGIKGQRLIYIIDEEEKRNEKELLLKQCLNCEDLNTYLKNELKILIRKFPTISKNKWEMVINNHLQFEDIESRNEYLDLLEELLRENPISKVFEFVVEDFITLDSQEKKISNDDFVQIQELLFTFLSELFERKQECVLKSTKTDLSTFDDIRFGKNDNYYRNVKGKLIKVYKVCDKFKTEKKYANIILQNDVGEKLNARVNSNEFYKIEEILDSLIGSEIIIHGLIQYNAYYKEGMLVNVKHENFLILEN